MTLIEQIRKDRMAAYKAKENIKKDVLGCLISESCKEAKEPEDKKVLSVIKKFIEGAEEMKASCNESDYEYYKACEEIKILDEYRPHQLSEDELKNILLVAKDSVPFQLGPLMKYLKTNHEGCYDGALAKKLIEEVING